MWCAAPRPASTARRYPAASASPSTATSWSGALSDDTLTEDDLASGRFDDAAVEMWLVDWSAPGNRLMLRSGELGEVTPRRRRLHRRGARAGVPARRGRRPALHRDLRCRPRRRPLRRQLDRAGISRHRHGRRGDVGNASCSPTASRAYADGWFTGGRLTWTSGANAGVAVEIKSHRQDAERRGAGAVAAAGAAGRGGRCLHRHRRLRQALRHLPRPLRQRASTSAAFPHMPGNDFVMRYAARRARPATTARRWRDDATIETARIMTELSHGRIVAEARRWIGTPYRHQASLNGRRLRLPRPGARRVARRASAASPSRCRPTRPTGRRRPARETLADAARAPSAADARSTMPRRATCCCSAGATACRPSTPPSLRRARPHGPRP